MPEPEQEAEGVRYRPMEIAVILALVILGPEKLPEAARAAGKTVRDFRAVADDMTRTVSLDLDRPSGTRSGRQAASTRSHLINV